MRSIKLISTKNNVPAEIKGGNIFFRGNLRTSVIANESSQLAKPNIFSNSIIKN